MYAHKCWSLIAYHIACSGCGPIPVPDVHTHEALDAWLSATARDEDDEVKHIHDFVARHGHLPGERM